MKSQECTAHLWGWGKDQPAWGTGQWDRRRKNKAEWIVWDQTTTSLRPGLEIILHILGSREPEEALDKGMTW